MVNYNNYYVMYSHCASLSFYDYVRPSFDTEFLLLQMKRTFIFSIYTSLINFLKDRT